MDKIEINKKVFEKYPKTLKELSCWQERQRRTALREEYKKRLISENAVNDKHKKL